MQFLLKLCDRTKVSTGLESAYSTGKRPRLPKLFRALWPRFEEVTRWPKIALIPQLATERYFGKQIARRTVKQLGKRPALASNLHIVIRSYWKLGMLWVTPPNTLGWRERKASVVFNF